MKFIKDKKKALKSYSFLSIASNFLVALSVSGLSVLGILSSELALPLVIMSALILGFLGLVGRFVDESVDDLSEWDEEDVQ